MNEVESERLPESLDPAEAFALLGNEIRIDILRALWDADCPVSFSDLHRRVDVDDSAQFNYHLGKLTDHFVRRTDDGYEFRHAGEKVVCSIFAGTLTDRVRTEFPVEGECHDCGGSLIADYEDEGMAITCTACPTDYGRYPFPPGGLSDRTPEEVMSAFNQRVRHLHCLAADGVCPECSGPVRTEIREDDENALDLKIRVDHRCTRCRHVVRSPLGLSLLDHSLTVSFYDDHGVELPTEPYWTLAWCVTDEYTTVLSRDPWRVRIDIPLADDVLSVTLDGNLTVIESGRDSPDPSGDTIVA